MLENKGEIEPSHQNLIKHRFSEPGVTSASQLIGRSSVTTENARNSELLLVKDIVRVSEKNNFTFSAKVMTSHLWNGDNLSDSIF